MSEGTLAVTGAQSGRSMPWERAFRMAAAWMKDACGGDPARRRFGSLPPSRTETHFFYKQEQNSRSRKRCSASAQLALDPIVSVCAAGDGQRPRQEPSAVVVKRVGSCVEKVARGGEDTWEGSSAEKVSAWGKRLGGDQKGVPVDVAASSGKVNTSCAIRSWNCVCAPAARKQVGKAGGEQQSFCGCTGAWAKAWLPQLQRSQGLLGSGAVLRYQLLTAQRHFIFIRAAMF